METKHFRDLLTLVGMGFAAYISYDINSSLGWALFHGILGWLYVIYQIFLGWNF
jgi:hypothetical protein